MTDGTSHYLTNVDLKSMGFCGTHLRPISQEVLEILIRKMSWKNALIKLLQHPSGAMNYINLSLAIFFWSPLGAIREEGFCNEYMHYQDNKSCFLCDTRPRWVNCYDLEAFIKALYLTVPAEVWMTGSRCQTICCHRYRYKELDKSFVLVGCSLFIMHAPAETNFSILSYICHLNTFDTLIYTLCVF